MLQGIVFPVRLRLSLARLPTAIYNHHTEF
jgi:hypothetical protein